MGEKVGQIDMKYVEKAKEEKRFIYVDWKTGDVMLSDKRKTLSESEKAKRLKDKKDKILKRMAKDKVALETLKG